MSVKDCVDKLVKTGKVSRAIADEAMALYDRARGEYTATMGPASADAAAALAVAKDMEASARTLKNEAAKQALAWANAERRALSHPKGPIAGTMSLLVRDIWEKGGMNVDRQTETIMAGLAAKFETAMAAYDPGILGASKTQIAGVKNLVREVFGVDTGDATAKAGAKGWLDATEEAVDRIRAAGRRLEPNEDWRVPQFWDRSRVAKVTLDEWKVDFLEEVRTGALKLWDRDTNRPATAARYDAILERAWKEVRTNSGGATFSPEMRTFQFQAGADGAEGWLRLQGKYGPGDNVMGMLAGHLNSQAREIALAEVVGPNHAAIIRALIDQAKGAAVDLPRGQKFLKFLESPLRIQQTYDVLTGKANAVEGQLTAGILGGLRSLSTAAQLKGAVISAVPGDTVTAALAATYNGMPVGRLVEGVVRELARGGAGSKQLAARLEITAHGAMDYHHGYRFFQDQVAGPQTLKALATTMIRAQGLSAWTEMMKRTFTMEFMGHLSDHTKFSLDKLTGANKPLRDFLDRHQISAAEWDAIRATAPLEVDKARFLDPAAITDRTLREKLISAVLEERGFAVLEPDARIRAITTGGLAQGTFMGEVSRNLFLFKSFSLTMAATHLMRIATQGPIEARVWNGASFMLFHAMAGALALQAKSIVYGKDPEAMDNAKFWGRSLLSGGGLGVYGDLINASMSRTGRSPIADLAGPIGGMAEDVARLSSAQVRKLYEDKDTTFGATAVGTLKRYTPGTFYTKLGVDRIMWDQVQTMVDPDYRASFRRAQDTLHKDTKQRFWWAPGSLEPRAPAFMGP